jgi:hypothetical protein
MKKRIRLISFLGLGLIVLRGATSLSSGPAPSQLIPTEKTDVSPDVLRPRNALPNLDGALSRYLELKRTRGAETALDFARRRGLDVRGGAIRLVVETRIVGTGSLFVFAAAQTVTNRISSFGGRIETRHRNLIQARLPEDAVASLARDPLVARIRLPRKPIPQKFVSEGVARTGAGDWKDLPAYRTEPAQICILDSGFSGYAQLLGSELPAKVQTRSFRADGDLEAGEDHGTACAEIVHDMAPQAELWLVNFETDVEHYEAVTWLVAQGIQVVSYSLGWYNAGAGDGTGPIDEDVAYAAGNGVLWASSAGNGATDHWDGNFVDTDGDGLHEFAPGDEILAFKVPAFTETGAFLNWKDWGTWSGWDYSGTDQDYDLILWILTEQGWQMADFSEAEQSGGDWPTEEIVGWYAERDATWGVSIFRYRASKNVRLELFAYNNSEKIEYNVPARSLTVPADAPGAIAVGASDAINDAYHPYSAQGPTWDGRMKPDLSAPSGVSTATYGADNFYGTSASAPHLAGALGLFLGGTPFTARQIRAIIDARAVDLGEPGRDLLFGVGRLKVRK